MRRMREEETSERWRISGVASTLAGAAKTSGAALALFKIIDDVEADLHHRHHHELGEPIERIQSERFCRGSR